MAEIKTKETGASVADYLARIENPELRADCQAVSRMLAKLTGNKAKMWGPSIVGFGKYHYKYDSGHEGDMCIAGFAARKPSLVVYLATEFEGRDELLAKLGKHKIGKSCLYIRRLSDIDTKVLEKLVTLSVDMVKRKYP